MSRSSFSVQPVGFVLSGQSEVDLFVRAAKIVSFCPGKLLDRILTVQYQLLFNFTLSKNIISNKL